MKKNKINLILLIFLFSIILFNTFRSSIKENMIGIVSKKAGNKYKPNEFSGYDSYRLFQNVSNEYIKDIWLVYVSNQLSLFSSSGKNCPITTDNNKPSCCHEKCQNLDGTANTRIPGCEKCDDKDKIGNLANFIYSIHLNMKEIVGGRNIYGMNRTNKNSIKIKCKDNREKKIEDRKDDKDKYNNDGCANPDPCGTCFVLEPDMFKLPYNKQDTSSMNGNTILNIMNVPANKELYEYIESLDDEDDKEIKDKINFIVYHLNEINMRWNRIVYFATQNKEKK